METSQNIQVTTDDLVLIIGEKEIELFSKRKQIIQLNAMLQQASENPDLKNKNNELSKLLVDLQNKNKELSQVKDNPDLKNKNNELSKLLVDLQNKNKELSQVKDNLQTEASQHEIVVVNLKKKIYSLREQVESPSPIISEDHNTF